MKTLTLAALILMSCGPARKPLTVVTTRSSCMKDVGPRPEVPVYLDSDDSTTDERCDKHWELCLSFEAAGKLTRYISEAKRWIRDVSIKCRGEI